MSFYRILPQKQRIVIVNYTSRNQKDVLILFIYYIIIFYIYTLRFSNLLSVLITT